MVGYGCVSRYAYRHGCGGMYTRTDTGMGLDTNTLTQSWVQVWSRAWVQAQYGYGYGHAYGYRKVMGSGYGYRYGCG